MVVSSATGFLKVTPVTSGAAAAKQREARCDKLLSRRPWRPHGPNRTTSLQTCRRRRTGPSEHRSGRCRQIIAGVAGGRRSGAAGNRRISASSAGRATPGRREALSVSLIALLDAGPLGLITNPRLSEEAQACNGWLESAVYRG